MHVDGILITRRELLGAALPVLDIELPFGSQRFRDWAHVWHPGLRPSHCCTLQHASPATNFNDRVHLTCTENLLNSNRDLPHKTKTET
jgi:hypothetical protein